MQIGIRLHDTIDGTIEERLNYVKNQGFSCVHMALGKVNMPSDSCALTPGYATLLRSVFRDVDLDIAVLGNYLNLAHPDKNELSIIQARYREHLRFAALLGCGVVGTETGAPNSDYHYDKEACRSQEALDYFINNLKPVVRDAERTGTIIAIEPVYRHIVWNPRRAREVLDRIDSPNLQIIFDPVNLLDIENIENRDNVIKEAIELLGPDIAVIHLKDYVIEGEKLRSVGCGFGELDYSEIVRFAEKEKPFIQATLEETTPETAVASRKCIEEYVRRIRG